MLKKFVFINYLFIISILLELCIIDIATRAIQLWLTDSRVFVAVSFMSL